MALFLHPGGERPEGQQGGPNDQTGPLQRQQVDERDFNGNTQPSATATAPAERIATEYTRRAPHIEQSTPDIRPDVPWYKTRLAKAALVVTTAVGLVGAGVAVGAKSGSTDHGQASATQNPGNPAETGQQPPNPEKHPPKVYLGDMTQAQAAELPLAKIMEVKTNNMDGTVLQLREGQPINTYTGPQIYTNWLRSVLSYPPYNKQLAQEARKTGECPSLQLQFKDLEIDDPTFYRTLCQIIQRPDVQDGFENNRRLDYFQEQAIDGDPRNELIPLADGTAIMRVAVDIGPGSGITQLRYMLAFVVPNIDYRGPDYPTKETPYRPYAVAALRISSGTFGALRDQGRVGDIK